MGEYRRAAISGMVFYWSRPDGIGVPIVVGLRGLLRQRFNEVFLLFYRRTERRPAPAVQTGRRQGFPISDQAAIRAAGATAGKSTSVLNTSFM